MSAREVVAFLVGSESRVSISVRSATRRPAELADCVFVHDGTANRLGVRRPGWAAEVTDDAEGVVDPDSAFGLPLDKSTLELSAAEYPKALELAYGLDQFDLFVPPEDDEMGSLVARVDGTHERFVSRAEDVYARYRGNAA